MYRLTGGKILGFLAFAILAAVWHLVGSNFGQTASFRFWGIALLVISLIFTCLKSIPVTLGDKEVEPLVGWRKAYLLIPMYIVGALVSVFPHEVACAVNLKGYICQ